MDIYKANSLLISSSGFSICVTSTEMSSVSFQGRSVFIRFKVRFNPSYEYQSALYLSYLILDHFLWLVSFHQCESTHLLVELLIV